ncbi:hypothetical protein ABGF49_07775 [Helcococcus ovis]|uniref:hypothetical protein n=1 Tax=Helcococcus TaxID=31983 RepID=UPI0038BC0EB3
MDLEKEKRIKKEISKFKKFTKDLSIEDKQMSMNLIEELGFMKVTLEDLKEEINESGVVTEMIQGEYSIMRENPALKSYNTMVQRYNATLKQLDEIINKNNIKSDKNIDLLGQFIQRK